MSFKNPITIEEALEKIQRNKYLLPAIQREFVWKSWQIEKLFDSLMNEYPIGSFLFWEVTSTKDFKFYEFIKKYDQRDDNHNKKIPLVDGDEIIAVLDGQQRLTALYIGLLGTYTEKLPYHRWDNPKAFPEKYLCLNLLDKDNKDIEEETSKYELKFCTKEEIEYKDGKKSWFKHNNILKYKTEGDILLEPLEMLKDCSDETKREAYKKLMQLFKIVNRDKIINYYLEKENNLDKVLNIFLRVCL